MYYSIFQNKFICRNICHLAYDIKFKHQSSLLTEKILVLIVRIFFYNEKIPSIDNVLHGFETTLFHSASLSSISVLDRTPIDDNAVNQQKPGAEACSTLSMEGTIITIKTASYLEKVRCYL